MKPQPALPVHPFPRAVRGTGWSKKNRTQGPFQSFRLARGRGRLWRHPRASGRRIGSSAGDGGAARRAPEANVWVFYGAGL
jgi:hypothetical protein